jgi:hypothetical protein
MAAKAKNQSSKKRSIPCRRISPEPRGILPLRHQPGTISINPCYKILTRNQLRDEFWLILLKCECNFTLTTLFVNFRRQGFLPRCQPQRRVANRQETATKWATRSYLVARRSVGSHAVEPSPWHLTAATARCTTARKQTRIHSRSTIVAPKQAGAVPHEFRDARRSQPIGFSSAHPGQRPHWARRRHVDGRRWIAQELPQ